MTPVKDLEEAERRIDARLKIGEYPNFADMVQVMHLLDYYRKVHDDRVDAEAVKLMDSGKVRLCDKLGCLAVIVKTEKGNRCAEGHESRWVDVRELNAANEQVAVLRKALKWAQWTLNDEAIKQLGQQRNWGDPEETLRIVTEVLKAVSPPDRGDRADRAESLLLSQRRKLATALATALEEREVDCECEFSPNGQVREVTCRIHQFTAPLWEALFECWPKEQLGRPL